MQRLHSYMDRSGIVSLFCGVEAARTRIVTIGIEFCFLLILLAKLCAATATLMRGWCTTHCGRLGFTSGVVFACHFI